MLSRREVLVVLLLCAVWYSTSSASSVVCKLVLTEFPYPLTVTLVQLASTAAWLAAALAACGVRGGPDVTRHWRALAPLALAKVLTTLCSQVSIWKVPVSYAHTVKATTPLWTALLSRVLLGERVSGRVTSSLLLIALGVALASASEMSFDTIGLCAALAAAMLLSLQHIYSKRLMKHELAHPLRLLQALSASAAMLVAPVCLCVEGGTVWGAWGGGRIALLLVGEGALAGAQAAAAFSVLARVAPLTYAVASAAKRAVVVAVSLLVLRNPAPPLNIAGMTLALAGVLAYHRARHKPAHTTLPV